MNSQTILSSPVEFTEQNLSVIELLKNGTAYSFSYGITEEYEKISILKSDGFDSDWEVKSACPPVEWLVL